MRIRAGAFGEGQPKRDLLLSPEHAVFLDGVLVPARCLIGCDGVDVEMNIERLTYYHVELSRHDVILADGLPCESWLDTGNRGMFENAPVVAMTFDAARSTQSADSAWANDACADLVTDGPILERLRARFGAAAPQDATLDTVGAHCIVVAPGAPAIRLVSSVGGAAGDARSLGVAIARIECNDEPIELTDGRLVRGFHAAEAGWRWTSGAGVIAFASSDKARVLRVDVAAVAPRAFEHAGTMAAHDG